MIGEAFGDRRLCGDGLTWIFQRHRDLDPGVAVRRIPELRHDRRAERKSLPSQDIGDYQHHGVEDAFVSPRTSAA